MMYRLKWQTEGPVGWGRVHQVIGDINAVHMLYSSLIDRARGTELGVNAEIRCLSAADDDGKIVYQWGKRFPKQGSEEPKGRWGEFEPR